MFTLRLREASTIPIDMTGILPETLEGLTLLEAAKKPVRCGNRVVKMGELFEIGPETHLKLIKIRSLVLEGECSNLHNLGLGMTRLGIVVRGNVGRHLGAKMSGGFISASGAASDWMGAEMSGGEIIVLRAGSNVGAAYVGSRRGMSGGHIAIMSHAGDEVGLRMRRGVIRIRGNCGSFAGAGMIAGTIVVDGEVGPHTGAGMKRGTIIVLQMPAPSPGFQYACEFQPQFINLYQDKSLNNKTVRLYRGDILTGGRGELWHIVS